MTDEEISAALMDPPTEPPQPKPLMDDQRLEIETEILAMIELLSDPSKWTTGAYARNAEGKEVQAYSYKLAPVEWKPVCFCLLGAAYHVHPWGMPDATITYLQRKAYEYGLPFNLDNLNDQSSREDVLEFLKRALADLNETPT